MRRADHTEGRREGRLLRIMGFCVLCLSLCFLSACETSDLFKDDLDAARAAMGERNWTLAERLLERYLRDESHVEKRWEAWNDLLTVINSVNPEPRATLEYLEAMLAEFADNDHRTALVLEQMGKLYENQHQYQRAVKSWDAYTGLSGLSPQQIVEGYRHLAAGQFSLRLFEAGEESLQQCLALPLNEKDKIMCMYDLADHRQTREQWQEVADLCRQILDSGPHKELKGLTGYLLGDALEQLGKHKEALEQFQLARDAYPNPAVMDNRIAHLRKKLKK